MKAERGGRRDCKLGGGIDGDGLCRAAGSLFRQYEYEGNLSMSLEPEPRRFYVNIRCPLDALRVAALESQSGGARRIAYAVRASTQPLSRTSGR